MERDWTAALVWGELVEAFRVMPGLAIYSSREGVFSDAATLRALTPLDVIAVAQEVLGRSSDDLAQLLRLARFVAGGGSAADWYRARGWSESGYLRWRTALCQRIADCIAAEKSRVTGKPLQTTTR